MDAHGHQWTSDPLTVPTHGHRWTRVDAQVDSAGFGFESRGAHEPPGQGHLFLKVAAEMALGEPKREPRSAHSTRFAPRFEEVNLNVMLFHSSRYGWTR
jgi:hypothetical protein